MKKLYNLTWIFLLGDIGVVPLGIMKLGHFSLNLPNVLDNNWKVPTFWAAIEHVSRRKSIAKNVINTTKKTEKLFVYAILYEEEILCGIEKYAGSTRRNQWKDRKIVFKWKSLPILFCLFFSSTSLSSCREYSTCSL